MTRISGAEKIGREILRRYTGAFVSKRDGFVIVKILKGEKTLLIWIRLRPISHDALELFRRIIKKHQYDELVLLKNYSEADYVKLSELKEFRVIHDISQI